MNRSRATTPATVENRSRTGTPAIENLNTATWLILIKEGKYFTYKQPGHRARDYPLKTTTSKLKNLEKLERVEE